MLLRMDNDADESSHPRSTNMVAFYNHATFGEAYCEPDAVLASNGGRPLQPLPSARPVHCHPGPAMQLAYADKPYQMCFLIIPHD